MLAAVIVPLWTLTNSFAIESPNPSPWQPGNGRIDTPFKDMGKIRGGNPFPIIGNNNFCLLLRFGHSEGHLACNAVRQDILQQVIENTGVGGGITLVMYSVSGISIS